MNWWQLLCGQSRNPKSELFFEDGFWHKLSWEPVITSRWWWPLAFSRTVWWWKYWEGSGGLNPLRKRQTDYWSTSKAIVMYQLLAKVSHKPSTPQHWQYRRCIGHQTLAHRPCTDRNLPGNEWHTGVHLCISPHSKHVVRQNTQMCVFLECTCKGP